MSHESNAEILEQLGRRYDAGFVTDIESDALPPGLSEDVVRFLSAQEGRAGVDDASGAWPRIATG